MDTLHPQAALLLGYVDQQLSPGEIKEAEILIANDDEAFALVETLKASQLPFRESFDFLLEDHQSAIQDTILASSEIAHNLDQNISTKDYASNNSVIENTVFNPDVGQNKKSSWQWLTSLAASLMLGLVIGYSFFSARYNSPEVNSWVTEVANYQLLYVRDTVTPAPQLDESQRLALQTKLSKALDSDFVIPDLKQDELTFKRGQILDIDGKPLIQLVYLPKDGLPIALCILKNDVADAIPKSGKSRGQSFIEWSKNGLSYVIIGKTDNKSLEAAAMNAMAQI